jgi:hypothetical protein
VVAGGGGDGGTGGAGGRVGDGSGLVGRGGERSAGLIRRRRRSCGGASCNRVLVLSRVVESGTLGGYLGYSFLLPRVY